MLVVLINASVNVSDDLYSHWYSPNAVGDTGESYNKIDHVLEYVVEICLGATNFFPEHRSAQTTNNAFHKAFLLDVAKQELSLMTLNEKMEEQSNAFKQLPTFIKKPFTEDAGPPPKSSLS